MATPKEASTCRSKSQKEDFESRPRKAVSSVAKSEMKKKEWNEQKLPKVLLGYSGGRLPERSKEEKGRE